MGPNIEITSDQLVVKIAQPGKVYSGSRFDWTGYITQVTLHGRHTFCPVGPVEDVAVPGLINEFSIFEAIGFEETLPGGQFPKLGVGLLTRADNEPYDFARDYEVLPFPTATRETYGTVEFTQQALPVNGYAAQLSKRLLVHENQLIISYQLESHGEKRLQTHEYCHNFVSIDCHPIGPGYTLQVPEALTPFAPLDTITNEGRLVTWSEPPIEPFYYRIDCPSAGHDQFWKLTYGQVGMREETDRPWDMMAVWGAEKAVSPEAFIAINLEPGESMAWKRTYTFFANDQNFSF